MNTNQYLRLLQFSTLALALLIGGCQNKNAEPSGSKANSSTTAVAATLSSKPAANSPAGNSGTPGSDAQAHDPAHPPIDCPLQKLGVDPLHLRPFDDVEKYIAFLEKPERAVWQKPDDVVAALGLEGSETLIDVGAGSGYFTFRSQRLYPAAR